MALVILTQSPVLSWEDMRKKGKLLIKRLLGQKRGQDRVVDSLIKGLGEINHSFVYNVKADKINAEDVVCVNGSYDALLWAIDAKREGRFKKLIVGPVMVVSPKDKHAIICDPHIDTLIVPSQWVKDFWLSVAPDLKDKITVWASGVDVYPSSSISKKSRVLIYKKNDNEDLVNDIKNFLSKNGVPYDVIRYGFYTHKKYLQLLDSAKALIFISESESQGIALCEAWMKDVPTLVWNRGYWSFAGNYWKDDKISAPYLHETCGLFFKDSRDFVDTWKIFFDKSDVFSPREYAISHFSNKAVAEEFLKLVK